MERKPPVTLEVLAAVLVRVAARDPEAVLAVLSDLGIEREAFERVYGELSLQLSEAWPKRKGIAAMQFASALGAELERAGSLTGARLPAPERPKLSSPTYLADSAAGLPSREPPRDPLGELFAAMAPSDPTEGTAEVNAASVEAALRTRGIPFGPEAGSALASPAPAGRAAAPEPDSPAQMTIERYAQILAWVERAQDAPRLLRNFGFTERDWQGADEAMRAALAADGSLKARFELLLHAARERVR